MLSRLRAHPPHAGGMLLLLMSVFGGSLSAATLTFSPQVPGVTDPALLVEFEQSASGDPITVTVSTTPNPSSPGDLLGLFINFAANSSVSAANLNAAVNDSEVLAECFNSGGLTNCGTNANNVNGISSGVTYELAFQLGAPGGGGGALESASFVIGSSFGLDLSEIAGVALRVQGTTTNGGSLKAFDNTPDEPGDPGDPGDVPEPSTFLLLGGSLGGLLILRRK